METVWGDFGSMALYYLKELAKREEEIPILVCKRLEPVYGVCTWSEYARMIIMNGKGMYRPVIAAEPDELMALMFARFGDFTEEEKSDADEESVQAGE